MNKIAQLDKWVKEFATVERLMIASIGDSDIDGDNTPRYTIFGARHNYLIMSVIRHSSYRFSAYNYLGCLCCKNSGAVKYDDFPHGELNRRTWNKIAKSIRSNEKQVIKEEELTIKLQGIIQ